MSGRQLRRGAHAWAPGPPGGAETVARSRKRGNRPSAAILKIAPSEAWPILREISGSIKSRRRIRYVNACGGANHQA